MLNESSLDFQQGPASRSRTTLGVYPVASSEVVVEHSASAALQADRAFTSVSYQTTCFEPVYASLAGAVVSNARSSHKAPCTGLGIGAQTESAMATSALPPGAGGVEYRVALTCNGNSSSYSFRIDTVSVVDGSTFLVALFSSGVTGVPATIGAEGHALADMSTRAQQRLPGA